MPRVWRQASSDNEVNGAARLQQHPRVHEMQIADAIRRDGVVVNHDAGYPQSAKWVAFMGVVVIGAATIEITVLLKQ